MTFTATLSQLIELLNAAPEHLPPHPLTKVAVGVCTDSRSLQVGNVFLALRGESFNGHQFAAAAIANGAVVAITDHLLPEQIPQLVVADTLVAYQTLGRWWRDRFAIPVIAITGSVGKTTTKELIAAVLGQFGTVLKTEANYNNEIGVPKTLLGLNADHDFAVIEMGMRGRGEIACLAKIARPDIGLITNVGTAHIERLGSREAIAEAKCELLAEMPKTSTAVLNADNPLLITTAQTAWSGQTLTYGLQSGDLQGKITDSDLLAVDGMTLPLPLPGEHNALNYLAALAIARLLNLDWKKLAQGLQVTLPDGRARRLELEPDIVLLDETYNASPESMSASLQLLMQTPGRRHLAVLGPMRELGNYSLELHRQVGQKVKELALDQLLILDTGSDGAAIADGASPLPSQQFAASTDLVDYLRSSLQPGDRVLFKASHAIGLQQVVEQLVRVS
jgi:UDP-N-acetylmuramoyl-tripeptide--D-alanyl-D-alanine ligase